MANCTQSKKRIREQLVVFPGLPSSQALSEEVSGEASLCHCQAWPPASGDQQLLWKTVQMFLKKLKIELPHDTVIPLMGIYPKKMKTPIQKDICTAMLIATLFTIAKTWKQPKCSSLHEWIKRIWYIHNGLLLRYKKRMKFCHLKQHGWTWRVLFLDRESQRKTNILYLHLYVESKKQLNEYNKTEADF